MYKYSYNITEYDTDQLLAEIRSQLNKKLISTYLGEIVDGYFESAETSINFIFYDELTSGELVLLNDLVTNYVYNPNYSNGLKFKINQSIDDPSQIDYDILGLQKKRTIIKGELRSVDYYNSYIVSSQTYSDLVVSEYRDYIRDDIGLAQSRVLTSNWLLNDGTTGLTLTFQKHYTPEEGIQEGIDRRGNMIAFAKTALLNGLAATVGIPTNQTYAFDLLTSVRTQMDYFTQGYTQPLRDAISGSTKAYMGACKKDRITVSTIIDSGASQTDTITINNVPFSFVSSSTPTQNEIATGLIALITGSTATSVSTYVSVINIDVANGIFDLKAKIPGWTFSDSVSSNLSMSAITANNNTLKLAIIEQLTF